MKEKRERRGAERETEGGKETRIPGEYYAGIADGHCPKGKRRTDERRMDTLLLQGILVISARGLSTITLNVASELLE